MPTPLDKVITAAVTALPAPAGKLSLQRTDKRGYSALTDTHCGMGGGYKLDTLE